MGFNCYIDESGDEGINTRGSRWFILNALIVPEEQDLKISEMVPRIKNELGKDKKYTLHWSHIKQHSHKLVVCKGLMQEQWNFSCVITDKWHPHVRDSDGFKTKWKLYCYSTRLLLERLSWFARDHGNTKANLIFEHRTNLDYEYMKDYLKRLKLSFGNDVKIVWANVNERFDILQKQQNRLLQASDSICGAIFDALEPKHGFTEPRYIKMLSPRIYRRSQNISSYGWKLLAGRKDEYEKEFPWFETLGAGPGPKDPTTF